MRKLIGAFCSQVNVPKYWSFIHVGLEGTDAVSKHSYTYVLDGMLWEQ